MGISLRSRRSRMVSILKLVFPGRAGTANGVAPVTTAAG
jgi:hypothetical protein